MSGELEAIGRALVNQRVDNAVVDLLLWRIRRYGDTRERAGIERAAKLRDALSDLTALVRGECPALLDGDRGGDGELSIHIDALLRPAPAQKEQDDESK